MAELRTHNVEPSSDIDRIRLVAGALFPADWIVELVGSRSAPTVVAVRVVGSEGKEVGRGIFQANHLQDVALFLNRLALALDGPPGGVS